MNASPHPGGPDDSGPGAAILVLGPDAEILASTAGARSLTGLPPEHLHGQPFPGLLTEPEAWARAAGRARADRPGFAGATLRHPGGATVPVRIEALPLHPDGRPRHAVTLLHASAARRAAEDRALLHALFRQSRVGLAIQDRTLRITRTNVVPAEVVPVPGEPSRLDLPADLADLVIPEDAGEILARLREVMEGGEPLIYWEHSARFAHARTRERVCALTSLRLTDDEERPLGLVSLFTDVTDQHAARRRMALLHTAAQRIGRSLDVVRNAQELAGVLVPGFADLAAVDLSEAVLAGDEPGAVLLGAPVRRVAATVADAGTRWPAGVRRVGETFRVEHAPRVRAAEGRTPAEDDEDVPRTRPVEEGTGGEGDGTEENGLLLPEAPGSRIVFPLRARGQVLGFLSLWRAAAGPAFTRSDAELAEEVGSRAALSVDNARRYTREHRTLETLQRSLLPRPTFDVSAASTAGSYVTAGTAAGVGGSWYDVIPLSSARVAFVIGDVPGHGLSATATMGRLRTAVQTLADLDLTPDELLGRLDDLAIRLADTQPAPGAPRGGAVGATCLYCVYDPISGQCAAAGAGRLPPVVAGPGQDAELVPLKAGPALGVGGSPFETLRFPLAPGSLLLLFGEDLITGDSAPGPPGRGRGDGAGGGEARERRLHLLCERVTAAARAAGPPAEVSRSVLDALLPGRAPANDVALLAARVQALPEGATAGWEFPAEPAAVGQARDRVLAQLKDWQLTANAFSTELIVSELVTNAVRYAGGPIGLRLIRNETLICEVSDPSETQPHLRRARPTDEGGRGLFLVAQLAHRWGSRYTPSGKTIWTEQLLDRG
ncbi:SpoIIE family protein phosphatase [Streptomyces sp. DSM 44917]|uniref:SpoIIE family protein phosphatase n=1 Tax=Streptomyces boetiae TaxID=3075541 RepID=A0ABU2LF83_9ACTN|nr:SpoIIE family protein phosphatase [Streptomyces sp. DSM 44917]MDT0310151.1 SpoIIE family protein phosphatase [Streptomyces sp. DSM 44917]